MPRDTKPRRSLICTAQGKFADACLAVCNYTQKHESNWFLHFSKRGVFFSLFSVSSSRLQPRISGQRLMMQRPYCAFAVEQKSQRHGFKASARRKQRHLHNPAPLPLRADREQTRWSQGWGSGNVMYWLWNIGPYPTQVVALALKTNLNSMWGSQVCVRGAWQSLHAPYIFFFLNTPVCLLTYSICPQLYQMYPFPESFLRAISSAEEFRPLPIASSTTGGPIILVPYRDGERDGRGGVKAAVQRRLITFTHTVWGEKGEKKGVH